jgi:hypothetical protein
VIHSVTGPVSAQVLMDEAQWAIGMYREAMEKDASDRTQFIAWSHQQASWSSRNRQDKLVHELLMSQPLPPLKLVYEEIFEKILGQKVSDAAPRLAQASARLQYAKKTGRPILFVMHDGGDQWYQPAISQLTGQLMGEYAVIVMPLKEGPALSQLTGQPPFQANGSARPLIVVARSDCTQLSSVSGWNEPQVATALARGWLDALERNPPNIRTLVRAQRLLRKVHPESADRARDLTIRVQEETRAAREASRDAESSEPSPRLAAK